ncbi:EAL domain-containing protein [Salidesulfovibrio brasiliensis]|uniref:EAL domain-containing protein n=1 Tax=Salidesulfovibrio brasiliensis TaxID=221711 RepID=UPI0006D2B88B|nr:EAL domain-containing protein [Salidesulfovibrio brasiliensis]
MKRLPKLFNRPFLSMALVFGLLATATSVFFAHRLETELTREYQSKALALARSIADSDVHTVINEDAAALQSRIDSYLDIEGVSYVLVADPHRTVISHTFVPEVPDKVAAIVDQVHETVLGDDAYLVERLELGGDERILHVAQPILGGLGGSIHIGMGLGGIEQNIRSAILQQQGIALVIFCASVFVLYLFIRNLSRPLQQLTEYARRVAAHDFSSEVDVKSDDELGQLAYAMESMAGDIHELIMTLEERVREKTLQLEEAKEHLEVKVEQRTEELSRINTQLKIEVAERKVIGDALKKAERKYRTIFENAVEGIYQVTPSGRFLSANPALARLFGYNSPDELMSSVYDIRTQLYGSTSDRDAFMNRLRVDGEVKDFELQVRRRDGRVVWVKESARKVDDQDGNLLYFEGSVEDITLRKKAEEQLRRQAFHDPLTRLPNRALFQDHLQLAMERGRRRKYLFAVLYLDLDRFKVINDSLGHDIGDELLKAISRVLESCARKMDTVARFGGDEFAILLEEIEAPRDAIRIARRILEGIRQPFVLHGNEVFTSASIGIVLNTTGYDRPEALLRDADTAMYRAKELGKSRFKVFNQKMHHQVMELMEMETDLRRALESDEVEVMYQPVIDMRDNSVAGFEALVRWHHPERGMVSPDDFIPVAEDTGLIYAIDNYVLKRACTTVRRWQKQFRSDGPRLTINTNLSGKHFGRTQLVRQVDNTLKETGIDPELVNLEITESALVDQPATAEEMLRQLKVLGVNLCIDDFGTGYSSLAYLQRFPIDVVKVDRTFVAAVEHDQDSRAIVRTILSLGASMNLKVVAEGVETKKQLDFLAEAGCKYVQGFLFYKPMSEAEAETLLEAEALSTASY